MTVLTESEWRVDVCVPWGALEPMMDWCRTHCKSNWQVGIETSIDGYQFIFVDDQDAAAFTMKWV